MNPASARLPARWPTKRRFDVRAQREGAAMSGSAEAKIPFGQSSDGRMVSIYEVARGLQCDCACAQCGVPLVACQGEIVRHYFRHHANFIACEHANETALHRFAKQVICQQLRLGLPDGDLGPLLAARAEIAIGDIRPDVLAEFAVEPVAIEIFVAHRVDEAKAQKYADRGVCAMEIDLSLHRFADRTDEEWHEIILYAARRHWIVPPRSVREENERRRQAEIAALLGLEEQARQQHKRAEAIRAAVLKGWQDRDQQTKIRAARAAEALAKQEMEMAKERRLFAEKQRINAELREAAKRGGGAH